MHLSDVGTLNNNEEVELSVSVCEYKSSIYTATEFWNSCQDGQTYRRVQGLCGTRTAVQ